MFIIEDEHYFLFDIYMKHDALMLFSSLIYFDIHHHYLNKDQNILMKKHFHNSFCIFPLIYIHQFFEINLYLCENIQLFFLIHFNV